MKTLLEHNRNIFKVIDKWLLRDREKEDKYANLICDKCGEILLYSGIFEHQVGPFLRRKVVCPNCGESGIKTIRMWELEMLKCRDVILEGE